MKRAGETLVGLFFLTLIFGGLIWVHWAALVHAARPALYIAGAAAAIILVIFALVSIIGGLRSGRR